MEYEPWRDLSFQDLMQAGKDAAIRRDYSRPRARVLTRRPKPRTHLSVSEVAALWGVIEQQVRAVLARKGIPGAFRSRLGRGKPWRIPFRLVDGRPVVEVLPGERGPVGRVALSRAKVPF